MGCIAELQNMGLNAETWHRLWRVEPLPLRNGWVRDTCLSDLTGAKLKQEQFLSRMETQACFYTHRALSKWGVSADYRLLLTDLAMRFLSALPDEWVSFCRPAQTQACHWCFITSVDRVVFLWHCKSRTKGISRGLSHFVLPEPCCSTRCTSR